MNYSALATWQVDKKFLIIMLRLKSGRVRIYFNCEYSKDDKNNHMVTNVDTNVVTIVTCQKVVMVHSNLVVPSMRIGRAPFPMTLVESILLQSMICRHMLHRSNTKSTW